jgi:hypothetical protein
VQISLVFENRFYFRFDPSCVDTKNCFEGGDVRECNTIIFMDPSLVTFEIITTS